jgi:small-conductance mechanosensitive channel
VNSIEPLFVALARDLQDLRALWQLGVIAASILVALALSHRLRPRLQTAADSKWEMGFGGLRRVLFPLTALAVVLIGRWVLSYYQGVSLLSLAVALLCAMAVIRAVIYVLRRTFAAGGMLQAFERTLASIVWLAFALHILGLTPDILQSLDNAGFTIGKQRISLLLIMQASLWVLGALLLSLWIGRLVEERLMSAQGINITLRVMLTKLVRALLLVLAILIVLPALGVDLTALSVLGGAIGVGIGFGLQKIASNYVSGFIILLDRSVTIGDLVTVDKHTGQLVKMSARYIVVRGLDGTEAIIPNETVITSTVVNQSYTDRSVRVPLRLQVSYGSDLERAMSIMRNVGANHPRSLPTPQPNVLIRAFGDNGIDLELGVWVKDPEAGTANLISDLYYALWTEFRAQGIEIPYPQLEVRARMETKPVSGPEGA